MGESTCVSITLLTECAAIYILVFAHAVVWIIVSYFFPRPSKSIYQNPNVQCPDIRRWGLIPMRGKLYEWDQCPYQGGLRGYLAGSGDRASDSWFQIREFKSQVVHGAYLRRSKKTSSPLLPYEVTVRGWPSKRKLGLIRCQICWHHDLRFPSLQYC